METKRLYIDGEGDLFWLDRVTEDGTWIGCWVRVGGSLVFKAAHVPPSFVEAVGMTPATGS